MLDEVLAGMVPTAGVIAFVECNDWDVTRMRAMVENATGVSLDPSALRQFPENWSSTFDVIATPIFHLADLATRSVDTDPRGGDWVFVGNRGAL